MQQKKEDLEKIIASLEKKVHEIVTEDREGQFIIDYRGKLIEIQLLNEKNYKGILTDIDKNRISLSINGIDYYFYKNAIAFYHIAK